MIFKPFIFLHFYNAIIWQPVTDLCNNNNCYIQQRQHCKEYYQDRAALLQYVKHHDFSCHEKPLGARRKITYSEVSVFTELWGEKRHRGIGMVRRSDLVSSPVNSVVKTFRPYSPRCLSAPFLSSGGFSERPGFKWEICEFFFRILWHKLKTLHTLTFTNLPLTELLGGNKFM